MNEIRESILKYVQESLLLPEPGDIVCLNAKFMGHYKIKDPIYGEVTKIDRSARMAWVNWDRKQVLPDVIAADHLEIDEDADDQDDEV